MAENMKDCSWAVEMYGIYICKLNALPCERVPKNLCDKEECDDSKTKKTYDA